MQVKKIQFNFISGEGLLIMGLFGFGKYKDDKILKQVNRSIDAHPMLKKKKNFKVTSEKGVIKLTGKVKSDQEKQRIEKVIKEKVEQSRINYKDIENNLEVE